VMTRGGMGTLQVWPQQQGLPYVEWLPVATGSQGGCSKCSTAWPLQVSGLWHTVVPPPSSLCQACHGASHQLLVGDLFLCV
jgi:hypothetical protein